MARKSLAVAAAIGLAVLLWALATLEGVFIRERDHAVAELAARRALLEDYAARALRDVLETHLDAARGRVASARLDPLIGASDLHLRVAGEQVLPRAWEPRQTCDLSARALYAQLADGDLAAESDEPGSPWAERLALLRQLRAALASGETQRIEQSVRDILRHRAHFVVPARRGLVYDVVWLESFRAQASPASGLMQKLLRDGLENGRNERPGLQRALLRSRRRLCADDFAFLAARVETLSERAGVRYADFSASASEAPGPRLDFGLAEPGRVLDRERGWVVEREDSGRVVGARVAVDELLAELTGTMRARGLLENTDALLARAGGPSTLAFGDLKPTVDSPLWQTRSDEIQRLFVLKTLLAAGFLLLALAVALLVAAIIRRGQRLVRLKSDFIATVSHELRTPLASIRIQAETLEQRISDIPGARDYPARIISDIDRLGFLVENILSFNRLEKGSWKPIPSVHRLCEITEDLRQDLSRLTDAKVRLTDDSIAEMSLEADPDLVRLLFLNLARNSCKYSTRDPVEIEIRVEQGRILYRDNGVGIAHEMWETVFDDFVRAPETGATQGAGLGLAICRRVMEAHAGQIRVCASDASGTTFEIDFGEGALRGAT